MAVTLKNINYIETGEIGWQDIIDNFETLRAATESGRCATIVVAASNSLHPEQADYVCPGVGDQVVIQAAIDALPNNGGRVMLMEGIFYINDTIHLYRDIPGWFNVSLEGQGLQATTIELLGNSNCDMIDNVVLANSSGWKGVADMQLSGNEALQSSGHGINCYESGAGTMYDMRFKNVFVNDVKQDGFRIISGWGTYIDRCLTEFSGGKGLYLTGAECYVYGFHSSGNGGHGIHIEGTEMHLSHSRIEAVDTGIHLQDLARSIVCDNTVTNFGVAGGNKRGIYLGDESYRNNIHDNIVVGGGGNSDYGFMMNINTVVGLNNIHDNSITGSDVADLYLAWSGASASKIVNNVVGTIASVNIGASNIIMNNQGINPRGVDTGVFDNTNYRIVPYATESAAPDTASTDYTVIWTPCRIISTGGTGVAIVIKDAAGTTICSPGATCDEELEIGWKINFGGFSAAPSVVIVFK